MSDRTCATPYGAPLAFLEEAALADVEDCVLWPFALRTGGYGQVRLAGTDRGATRVLLSWITGDMPALHVLHSCDRPACVNWRHLRWGTAQDNSDDAVTRDRRIRGERHHQAKVTEVQAGEIRRLREAGATLREVGARYGLSVRQVGRIAGGLNWSAR